MKSPSDIFELLEHEHSIIKRMLKVIRERCKSIIEGNFMDKSEFAFIIDFIRNYADGHHHGKEEDILFTAMLEEKGLAAEKMIMAMNTEHDLGRAYVQRLEDALEKAGDGNKDALLDVIANAVSYADLLERHIAKEDNVLYRYARIRLSQKTLDRIGKDFRRFESESALKGTKDKYIGLLDKIEN